MSDVLKEYSEKSKIENEYTLLSSTNNGIEKRSGRTLGSSNKGYKILKRNTLVLSPQNLWLGNINFNDLFNIGLVSPSYKTFKIKKDFDELYIKYLIKQPYMLYQYKMASVQGASVVRRNLEIDSFYEIPISSPLLNEQNKIGILINKISKLIDSNERKQKQISILKKLLMQKLFNTSWRFNGFSTPWEQRKFSDLFKTKNGIRRGPFGSSLKKDIFVKESDFVVFEQRNAIYDKYNFRYNISEEKYNKLIKFNVVPGDFLMSGSGTIGKLSRVPETAPKGVFNQALIRFRINKLVDSEYFLQFMNNEDMQNRLTNHNPGSAMTNLVPISEMKNWEVDIPNVDEQNEIGQILKKIDKIIIFNDEKLNLLKQLKKHLMQNMFI